MAAYFTFDGSAYGLALALRDAFVQVPEGYSYTAWMREPLPLKWHIVGLVPAVRYVPAALALIAAGVVQVLLLRVGVRDGVLFLLTQGVGNLVALVALLFLLPTAQGFLAGRPELVQNVAALGSRAAEKAGATRPAQGEPPARSVRVRKPGNPAALPAYLKDFSANLTGLRERVDPYLDSVKKEATPVTVRLPARVQRFLDKDGGWWLVLGTLALLFVLWFRSMVGKVLALR